MDFRAKTFLIIAGQPKAGTTSLFDWLAQHPDICASNVKETRFFVDAGCPMPRSVGFDGANLANCARVFNRPERKVLMEATPDCLYSDKVLEIADLLPNAKIVVIERGHVDRVCSAYRLFRQRGMLPTGMSLDASVARQIGVPVAALMPEQFRVLDHCRPAHLDRIRKARGDRLLVLDFATLKQGSQAILEQVCRHLGVAPPVEIWRDTAKFTREARSRTAARPYYGLDGRRRLRLRNIPVLRPVGRTVRCLLSRPAGAPVADAEISPAQAGKIRAIATGVPGQTQGC